MLMAGMDRLADWEYLEYQRMMADAAAASRSEPEGFWGGFYDGYVKACYGVANTILGGLFGSKNGLLYQMSPTILQWSQDSAFETGANGWRTAEGPLLATGGLMGNSASGAQYRWFRKNVLSWNITPEGGVRLTVGGRLTYVGKHLPVGNEPYHTRQIEWTGRSLFKW